MDYREVVEKAKKVEGFKCRICPQCSGKVCKGEVPGVGGKGTGASFIRNVEKLEEIKVNMDTIYQAGNIDTSVQLFGKNFELPVFAAPIGGLPMNYGGNLSDYEYSKAIIEGCKAAGSLGFTGDGAKEEWFVDPVRVIEENDGWGIPTIKPWEKEKVIQRIRIAEQHNVTAIAMDIDAAGLIQLARAGTPVNPKPMEALQDIIHSTELPFIIKGIMTVKGALKCLEAGAYGIVISNHGGRVLDHTPATVEVLPEIVQAVGGKMKIFIDGGIRTGLDVLKVLALGADSVLIGRPYGIAAYGAGAEGVKSFTEKVKSELIESMIMTGCSSIQEINIEIIYKG